MILLYYWLGNKWLLEQKLKEYQDGEIAMKSNKTLSIMTRQLSEIKNENIHDKIIHDIQKGLNERAICKKYKISISMIKTLKKPIKSKMQIQRTRKQDGFSAWNCSILIPMWRRIINKAK